MVPFDYHLHTKNTEDGCNTLLEMAERAAAVGLREIAVTDHYIPGIPGYCVGPRQVEQHFKDAEVAEARFGLTVRIGLEADLNPKRLSETEDFFRMFDFDIILGGAHLVDGFVVGSEDGARGLFAKYGPHESFRLYFEHLLETVRSGLFDIMAHLDVVRKFARDFAGDPRFEDYAEYAIAVVEEMARRNVGFEINCRGCDHGVREPYPSPPLLALLREHGIEKVTIGTDAHWLDAVGTFLDTGLETLRRAGFTRLCAFQRREPLFTDISGFYT
jgi:histidinol-phosphatase (PHP family)